MPLARFPSIGLVCLSLFFAPNAVFAANGVLLQGLDKITARVSTIEAPINKAVRFGSLEIKPHYSASLWGFWERH